MICSSNFILWLDQVRIQDVSLVGGKNASLGEMISQLTPKGIRVPGGFAVTAAAYRYFLKTSGLDVQLEKLLDGLNSKDVNALRKVGRACRTAILSKPLPKQLETAIQEAYKEMCEKEESPDGVDVAVRSSATAEDLPNASFAGQQETFLNIHGASEVVNACKRCFASLFTDRAISYRVEMGFDHHQVALSVGVQKMVRSDLAASGVMFTIDTESGGFKNACLINSAYGLGENIVQGAVNPDEFLVFKPTLKTGFRPILEKRLGTKEIRMIYDIGGSKSVKNVPQRNKFSLTDDQILVLSQWACIIEDHYTEQHQRYCPMDIEWALDGQSGKLYIVQARPETVVSQKSREMLTTLTTYTLQDFDFEHKEKILATGNSVGSSIGQGRARVITKAQDMCQFLPGEVLITHKTDPDWEPIMKKASAIVTDLGGRTCHAAIIARELGIPAVVGCSDAMSHITTGSLVTVTCANGGKGYVLDGAYPFEKQEVVIKDLPRTRTQIMMNVGNPQDAFRLQNIPCDGVGLARLEFIIANHVKVHPLALVHFNTLNDSAAKSEIAEMTSMYSPSDKPQYFIDKLASGIAMIAAAFYPRPVVVRLSDFKSNEYSNLLGGKEFEPNEENPMLGWRGASRYYHEKYRKGFALECKAFVKVRKEMGLVNVIPMVPFCRTPAEGEKVVQEMKNNGLERGVDGLQVYCMCEIPSNVLLADEFLNVFDGFSIGSNDLTQLVLGLDRDSEIVASLFDERNDAVKDMIARVIKVANKRNKKIGICGQAPSDYPDFAQFLVSQGIHSISLNSDSVLKTILEVDAFEKSMPKPI